VRKLAILLAFLLTGGIVWACGDKLMLVMGVRLAQIKNHPAAILVYPVSAPSAAVIRQIPLQPALAKAGHKFQVADDPARLADALKNGRYDLVMADLGFADELAEMVRSSPSHPVILPVAYNLPKAEQSAAQKRFHCLLKAPSDSDHYLEAIADAMEWKAKTARH
jgi:CheY-like chemotaxis protein